MDPMESLQSCLKATWCAGSCRGLNIPSVREVLAAAFDPDTCSLNVTATVTGTPIELGGFEALYDGVPAHIEIIRDDETGNIIRYVAYYKDGSGTIVDPADLTMLSVAPTIVGISTTGFDACHLGNTAFIEIVRSETGLFDHYVAHYKDGSGTIVDPALLADISECPTAEEPIPYDWACANRNCRVQNFTFSFDETQFISQEIVSSTGSGQQYTGQYIFATPADALSFYQMYSLMALPGARANAAGFLNYHPGFFVSGSYDNNVTVEVVFDLSNTTAANDAAAMCGFVEPAGEYATTASFLAGFWDPIVGAGPQLGGAFSIDVSLYTGGNTPLQLLKYVDPITGDVRDRALIYMPGFPDHLTEFVPGLGETVAAGLCPVAPLELPEVVEIPKGATIVNTASLAVLVGIPFVQSFSVKGLGGKTYDISFDGGTTWNIGIDGGDSWGEGNIEQLNVADVFIRPTVTGDNVFVHWEVR